MTQQEKGVEFKVGAFVFLGLLMLGALVVQFGRVGEGFKTYYALTIKFSDASGLLKGSDVLLAGAKIGKVAGGPRLAGEGTGVLVPLKIYDYVKIPLASKFAVGSSGLLGDRFVTVTMPPGKPTEYVKKGAVIEGHRETGLDDLTKQGGELIEQLKGTAKTLDDTITRLNQEALSPQNMENLKGSFAHLNEATGSLAATSKKLDGTIEKADATMDSIHQDADDLNAVVGDARKTVQSANDVFRQATAGKGLLPTLLTNQALADDLRALIANLRAHGVLFYRDNAAKTEVKPQPAKPKPTGGRP